MAPHWSGMSVETYIERVREAIDAQGVDLQMTFVRSFHEHPLFISWLSDALRQTLDTLDDGARARPTVLFTAHSLPVRTLADGTQRCKTCDCDVSCRYRDGLQATADLVAATVGLEDHRIAWQSVGRTADPWWGPGIDEVIPQLVADGRTAVVVCCAGFVADHLETLYDLDIEASAEAAEAGLAFARRRCPTPTPRSATCSPRSCVSTWRGCRHEARHLERELDPATVAPAPGPARPARARRGVPAGDQGGRPRVPHDGDRRRGV